MFKRYLQYALLSAVLLPPKQVGTGELPALKMRWDAKCILDVLPTAYMHIEAPLKGGKPDLKQATLHGLEVVYLKGCGHVEK